MLHLPGAGRGGATLAVLAIVLLLQHCLLQLSLLLSNILIINYYVSFGRQFRSLSKRET